MFRKVVRAQVLSIKAFSNEVLKEKEKEKEKRKKEEKEEEDGRLKTVFGCIFNKKGN